MSLASRAYLSVLRSVRTKFVNDVPTQQTLIRAIRSSVAEMDKNNFTEEEIVTELMATRTMMNENLAQVAFNQDTDSYTVRLTEDHLNGGELNIQTPDEMNSEFDDLDNLAKKNSHNRN